MHVFYDHLNLDSEIQPQLPQLYGHSSKEIYGSITSKQSFLQLNLLLLSTENHVEGWIPQFHFAILLH